MSSKAFLVLMLMLASASCNYTNILWEHQCEPGSQVFACSIPEFLYIPGQNSSRVIEPDIAAMRRISIMEKRIVTRKLIVRQTILRYDAALHAQLKRPRAIEISSSNLRKLEIPIDLEYGIFKHSFIYFINVFPSETPYALRYLDLTNNVIEDIRNLTMLVNLETLNLFANRIRVFNNQMFLRMANLTTLVISANWLTMLSFSVMPPRLEKIYVEGHALQNIDFTEVYLPALDELALSYGVLSDLDVTALLKAAPKLKKIRLISNQFGLAREINISVTLKAAGVTYDDGFGEEGTYQDIYKSNPNDGENENDTNRFYRDRKVQFWEHTIAWLLAIGNSIVLVWAAFGFYREKQKPNA